MSDILEQAIEDVPNDALTLSLSRCVGETSVCGRLVLPDNERVSCRA